MSARRKPAGSGNGKINFLIVNPPALLERDFIDYPCFANLGALQHAAVLESAGFGVEVADAFSLPGSGVYALGDERILVGCRPETLVSSIRGRSFDALIVCMSVFHKPFARSEICARTLELLKSSFGDVPLIAADAYSGGMHYIDYGDDDFFGAYPDAGLLARHETENTVLKWALAGSGERRGSGVLPYAPVAGLDSLPFPAWHDIEIQNYFRFLDGFFKSAGRADDFKPLGRYLPLFTSRGCLHRCAFCSSTTEGLERKYRTRDPEKTGNHLADLRKKYSITGVAVLDGLANGNAARFETLLRTLAGLGLKVLFVNGLRADRLTEKHFRLLPAVAPSLAVSAESASERVRNGVLEKKLALEKIERAAARCAAAGPPLQIHYMIGAPGETTEEVNETLEHAARMALEHGAEPLLQFCAPLPGCALARRHPESAARPDENGEGYFGAFHTRPAPGGGIPPETLARMAGNLRLRLRERAPEKLIVNLTYRCDNRCVMCAAGGLPAEDNSFARCAELLKEYRAAGVRMVDFDGGEPTLHPDFLRLAAVAGNLGYSAVSVTTNGRSAASREFASRLLLSGITNVLVSIHGPDARVHESVTRVPGSFGQTVAGIRNIVRLKPGRVGFGLNTVVTKSNYRRLREIAAFACEAGARELNVQFPTPFGRAAAEHAPPMRAALRNLEDALREFRGRLALRVVNLPPCLVPPGADAAGDAEKFGRVMAFVNAPPRNLGSYLAQRRSHGEKCSGCEYYIICGGFYTFGRGRLAGPGPREGEN